MKIMFPEYENSLLSLVSSVLSHYCVETTHNTLSAFDALLKKKHKNVVFMLFDGMGSSILEKHLSPDSFLRRNMRSIISSVFPPTTTTTTVTMETGLSPVEHGWLGWSLYFEEIGSNVDIFPNTLSRSEGIPAACYHVAGKYLPFESIGTKISKATEGRVKAYTVSPFSSFRIQSMDEIFQTIEDLCNEEGEKNIYSYRPQPDSGMHEFGTNDIRITASS
jgi:hypothetical protein